MYTSRQKQHKMLKFICEKISFAYSIYLRNNRHVEKFTSKIKSFSEFTKDLKELKNSHECRACESK